MSPTLDHQIRRAMSELAEAAPVSRPFEDLVDTPLTLEPIDGRSYRRPTLVLSLVAAICLLIAIVVNTRDRSEVVTVDTPPTTAEPSPTTAVTARTTIAPTTTSLPPQLRYHVPTPTEGGLTLQSVRTYLAPNAPQLDPSLTAITQLFGTDPDGDPDGTYIEVTSQPEFGQPGQYLGGGTVQLRGVTVQVSVDPTATDPVAPRAVAMMWIEDGRNVSVNSPSISLDRLTSFVAGLRWEPDPVGGFAPDGNDLSLVYHTDLNPSDAVTYQYTTGEFPALSLSNVTVMTVDQGQGSLARLWQYGTRLPSGVRLYLDMPRDLYALLPDGTPVNVLVPEGENADRPEILAMIESLRPGTLDDLEALPTAGTDQLASIPLTAAGTVDEFVVEARSNVPDATQVVCLVRGDQRACRPVSGVDLTGGYVELDGAGYFIGFSDGGYPEGITVGPVLAGRTGVDGNRTYWVAPVPVDFTDNLATIQDPGTGFVRPVCCRDLG